MRRLALVAPLLLAAGFLSVAEPAQAAADEQMPCGALVLRVQHAASADFYDTNHDRLECWARQGGGETSTDDFPLNTAPSGPDSRKFFSFGTEFNRPTSVVFVDTATHTFGGYFEGQEDDADFDGCRFVCAETVSYDSNDYFYFDTGSGSTKVSMAYFEAHAQGQRRFSMVYSRLPAESSVFSFEAAAGAQGLPPVPPRMTRPTAPRGLTARSGNHKAFLHWRSPVSGQPIDAYQVRRNGKVIAVAGARVRGATVRGLTNNRVYRFTIRAHNAAGWGPWSAVARVRPHR
ncbi:fibronectin type III domain-containing protein [Marmoricola sp. RAF53]|uniref:fibronectin type III domain-containing protein n=1 Tax=Marmoricola sp. RAF53 TaxID=3233059 RepID=UPI003F992E1F